MIDTALDETLAVATAPEYDMRTWRNSPANYQRKPKRGSISNSGQLHPCRPPTPEEAFGVALEDVEMKYLVGAIPRVLRQNLWRLPIDSLADLLEFDPGALRRVKGVAGAVVIVFKCFLRDFYRDPERYAAAYRIALGARGREYDEPGALEQRILEKRGIPQLPLFNATRPAIPEELFGIPIEEVELNHLVAAMPHRLALKLGHLRLRSLDELLKLNPVAFSRDRGVGLKTAATLEEFQSDVARDPQKYAAAFKESLSLGPIPLEEKERPLAAAHSRIEAILLPSTVAPEASLLDSVRALGIEWVALARMRRGEAARNWGILYECFAIETEPRTLAEIGRSHGISRERCRQVQASELSDLRGLLLGKTLRHPLRRCPAALLDRVAAFLGRIGARTFLPWTEIRSMLGMDTPAEDDPSSENFLTLVAEALGFERMSENGMLYGCSPFVFSRSRSANILRAMRKALRKHILPLEDHALRAELLRKFPAAVPAVEDLVCMLRAMPECEETERDGQRCFRLRFDKLHAEGRVYTMLCESEDGMDTEELVGAINRRLEECGSRERVKPDYVERCLLALRRPSPDGCRGALIVTE